MMGEERPLLVKLQFITNVRDGQSLGEEVEMYCSHQVYFIYTTNHEYFKPAAAIKLPLKSCRHPRIAVDFGCIDISGCLPMRAGE